MCIDENGVARTGAASVDFTQDLEARPEMRGPGLG